MQSIARLVLALSMVVVAVGESQMYSAERGPQFPGFKVTRHRYVLRSEYNLSRVRATLQSLEMEIDFAATNEPIGEIIDRISRKIGVEIVVHDCELGDRKTIASGRRTCEELLQIVVVPPLHDITVSLDGTIHIRAETPKCAREDNTDTASRVRVNR